jgi:hypothetical protein
MSSLATTLRTLPLPAPAVRCWPFFVQEYLRLMRGRSAILLWLLLVYTVLVVPWAMTGPQEEIVRALGSWLGEEALGSKLIFFIWIDATMNKTGVILGIVLAGGILVDERARGTSDLYRSKPIGVGDYFTIKLLASCAALATFYLGAAAGALLTFPWRIGFFDPADFVVLSVVHLFAAIFAATFSGTAAVWCGNRLTGMLVSIVVLGTLVGLAFLGFYYPDLWAWSHLNPFFVGVLLIGSLDQYGWWDVAWPVLLLVAINVGVAAIGRRRAVALMAKG